MDSSSAHLLNFYDLVTFIILSKYTIIYSREKERGHREEGEKMKTKKKEREVREEKAKINKLKLK